MYVSLYDKLLKLVKTKLTCELSFCIWRGRVEDLWTCRPAHLFRIWGKVQRGGDLLESFADSPLPQIVVYSIQVQMHEGEITMKAFGLQKNTFSI